MGAIKPGNYSNQEINLSLIHRALAHPMRIQIVKIMLEHKAVTANVLAKSLSVTITTIKDHLEKLHDGQIIQHDYIHHAYLISLHPNQLDYIQSFINYYPVSELALSPHLSKFYS